MSDEELAKIHFLLYLKCVLLSNDRLQIIDEYSKSYDDIIYCLDGIDSLLEKEKGYLYFDDVIISNIFNYLSYVRHLKPISDCEIINRVNSIIISLNNINSSKTIKDKYDFYEEQLRIRAGVEVKVNNRRSRAIYDSLKTCFSYDYLFFDNILYSDEMNLDSNITYLFGSLNYYVNYFEELCSDNDMLNIISDLNSVAGTCMIKLYKIGKTDSSTLKQTKKISECIDVKVKEYKR